MTDTNHVEVLRRMRIDAGMFAFDDDEQEALDAAIRALSPAGGGGRGCDWYEDEDTGSRIVDFDFASDHSRQLSLILKANGEVAYAAYINGTHMNGADAMTPEFYSAIRMLSASPQKSPTVGDWMMVPARLTGPMAYAMVERLGHPDSSPQDCWTATLAASPQQEPGAVGGGVRWELLPSYLIDHCEGDTISEEGLQHAVAAMLRDPKYSHSKPTPADESGADEFARVAASGACPACGSHGPCVDADACGNTAMDTSGQTLAGAGDPLLKVLADLLDHVDRETCTHEEVHRGGAIWTICDSCGRKWADDEGGFVQHEDAPAVAAARAALTATSAGTTGECQDCAWNPGLCDTHDTANSTGCDDSARLDWLEANPESIKRSGGGAWVARDDDGCAHVELTLRSAIDAARNRASTATSAGTTGDDSARLDWLLSRIPDTVLLFHGAAVDEGWPDKSPSRKGIDAARRAWEVGND